MAPVYDRDFLEKLESVAVLPFSGHVWRHMFNEYDPARSNTRGARWNPPGVAAVYTSLERSTAIAEADHAIEVQPLRPHLSRQVYELSVAVGAAVDLRDYAVLAALGVGPTELAGDDHSACQAIGGAAYWLERDGLLVPSARAGGINLVVFTDRLDVDAAVEVLSRENLPTEP